MNTYCIEYTDTFGGEANYSWVLRFKVSAKSAVSAIRKFTKKMGLSNHLIKEYSYGDFRRYNVKKAAQCVFIFSWDDECDSYSKYETL